MKKLLESCITDFKSARAIALILKRSDPTLTTIDVPYDIAEKIRDEMHSMCDIEVIPELDGVRIRGSEDE